MEYYSICFPGYDTPSICSIEALFHMQNTLNVFQTFCFLGGKILGIIWDNAVTSRRVAEGLSQKCPCVF